MLDDLVNKLTTDFRRESTVQPIDPAVQVALSANLRQATIVFDYETNSFCFRNDKDSAILTTVNYLATHYGLALERGVHPVTKTDDAIMLRVVGSDRPFQASRVLQAYLNGLGAFFQNTPGRWTRETGEPSELPKGHDCVLAPKAPHPLQKAGTLVIDGNTLYVCLAGLSSEQMGERRGTLARLWGHQGSGAQFYDRNIPHPITEHAPSTMAVTLPERDPQLAIVQKLPNCFTKDGRTVIEPLWINGKGHELSDVIMGKIALDARFQDNVTMGLVKFPIGHLDNLEQYYLRYKMIEGTKKHLWGVTGTGYKDGWMGIQGNPRMLDDFSGAQATQAGINSLIQKGEGYRNPFADLVPGIE